jgi:hypothetical protein
MREFASMTGRRFSGDGNFAVSISSTQPNSPLAFVRAQRATPPSAKTEALELLGSSA